MRAFSAQPSSEPSGHPFDALGSLVSGAVTTPPGPIRASTSASRTLAPLPASPQLTSACQIRRKQVLSGLINEYERAALNREGPVQRRNPIFERHKSPTRNAQDTGTAHFSRSQHVTPEHRSDTDHPCIERYARIGLCDVHVVLTVRDESFGRWGRAGRPAGTTAMRRSGRGREAVASVRCCREGRGSRSTRWGG